MTMSFNQHWKAYGKKKGKSKSQWQSKYDKYLAKVGDAVDDIEEEEEEVYTMATPRNFVDAEPVMPTFDNPQEKEHLAFRQVSDRTGKAELRTLRPVITNTTGRNLFGTSGDSLKFELVEE